jgi:hypothetical protein
MEDLTDHVSYGCRNVSITSGHVSEYFYGALTDRQNGQIRVYVVQLDPETGMAFHGHGGRFHYVFGAPALVVFGEFLDADLHACEWNRNDTGRFVGTKRKRKG